MMIGPNDFQFVDDDDDDRRRRSNSIHSVFNASDLVDGGDEFVFVFRIAARFSFVARR